MTKARKPAVKKAASTKKPATGRTRLARKTTKRGAAGARKKLVRKTAAARKKTPTRKASAAPRRKTAARKAATAPRRKTAARKAAATPRTRAATRKAAAGPRRKVATPKAVAEPRAKAAAPKPPAKLDLIKLNRDQYVAPTQPVLLFTQPAQYLAVSGQGTPGGAEFQAQLAALYGVAFTIKMAHKAAGRGDYVVGTLEGLWWHDRPDLDFANVPPEELRWQLLIRTPDEVTPQDLDAAVRQLLEKKKDGDARKVGLITLDEGLCVQVLHVGPYDRESETLARMADFARGRCMELHGRHHEVYLSDPRRVPSEKLRTILRMPVKRQGA